MLDPLNTHVPREVVEELFPCNSDKPILTIEEVGVANRLCYLKGLSEESAVNAVQRLKQRSYQWQTLKEADGTITIVYFEDIDDTVIEALYLFRRDIGVEEPPLSINEHMTLGRALGILPNVMEAFKNALLAGMRRRGLLEQPLIKPVPVLTLVAPNRLGESAKEWAVAHADKYGYTLLEAQVGPYTIGVTPQEGLTVKEVSERLDADGVAYDIEVVLYEQDGEPDLDLSMFASEGGWVWHDGTIENGWKEDGSVGTHEEMAALKYNSARHSRPDTDAQRKGSIRVGRTDTSFYIALMPEKVRYVALSTLLNLIQNDWTSFESWSFDLDFMSREQYWSHLCVDEVYDRLVDLRSER